MARTGRPSTFDQRFVAVGLRLALLGKTDAEIAHILGVSRSTLNKWKASHPDFADALTRGRDDADGRVAASLFQRALGYSHREEKLFLDRNGNVVRAETTKHYPPDTVAAIFWLKNRQRPMWFEARPRDHTPPPDVQDEAERLMAAMQAMDDLDTARPAPITEHAEPETDADTDPDAE